MAKYVCKRCGQPCGYWHFGWKHQTGGKSKPTCGKKPIPIEAENPMAKPPEDPKDWKVEYSDQVNEKAADNPEVAEALRDFTSRLRQAMHDLEAGKFLSHDEAMRSIGGEKVDPDEVPEEVMDAMEEEMEKRKRQQ